MRQGGWEQAARVCAALGGDPPSPLLTLVGTCAPSATGWARSDVTGLPEGTSPRPRPPAQSRHRERREEAMFPASPTDRGRPGTERGAWAAARVLGAGDTASQPSAVVWAGAGGKCWAPEQVGLEPLPRRHRGGTPGGCGREAGCGRASPSPGSGMFLTDCFCTPCPVLESTECNVPILQTSQIIFLLGSWRNCLNNKIVFLKLVPLKKMISFPRRNDYTNLYMWCVCVYVHTL